MPCRSSRASISVRPRERCERARRPIGASGGGCCFGGASIFGGASGFGEATGFDATETSASSGAVGGFKARCRLRSGLTCFATLSHSARSSSLKPRLRRGGGVNSGIEVEGRRFICGSDSGGWHGGGGGGKKV